MPGSLAARVTYLLEPKNWLIVTVVGVGAHADGWAGAGWGLLAAFFAGDGDFKRYGDFSTSIMPG